MPDIDENEPRRFLRLRPRRESPSHESNRWPAPNLPVTDTRAMVQANVEHDIRAGRYKIKRARRPIARRIWDFLVMFVIGNGSGFAFLRWFEAGSMTTLWVGIGMAFYTLMIGWVMFVHMDDY